MLNDACVFVEGRQLWTPVLLEDLHHAVVEKPDESEASFYDKLHGQLSQAAPQARQLMAEMLWLLMLFQSNITPDKKRQNVSTVWSWSGESLGLDHPLLADDVLTGIGSTGTGYNTHRWRELVFLIALARALKAQPEAERRRLLSDPWIFSSWVGSVPRQGHRQLPHILCYLCFPDSFERITTPDDKRRILQAFAGISEDVLRTWNDQQCDRALLDLRHRLEAEENTTAIDYYEPTWAARWRPSAGMWLLSWNPEKWTWASLPEDRIKTSNGLTVIHDWRCRSKKAREGDTAYLLRTGVDPKGIVAVGNIVKAPYDLPHRDADKAKAGETTTYVDVEFTAIRDATKDAIVPLAELEHLSANDQLWNAPASGIEIKPKAAAALAKLWQALPPPVLEPHATVRSRIVPAAPRNLILYGPPGTGKTWTLRTKYLPAYEQRPVEVAGAWIETNLADLGWWEVVFMALFDRGGNGSVDDILAHPYFVAKANASDNKSLRATCWNALQFHAPLDSQTVKTDVTRRFEPFVFDKTAAGQWKLVGDWKESCGYLVERAHRIKHGPHESDQPIRRYEFVTFHQAYAYEDFVEGIRPQIADGGVNVVYDVVPGIFKRLCARAKKDQEHRYAIFIDEINRGNIAKIFGELITLIEVDKRAIYDSEGRLQDGMQVTLPYSGELFGVPINLDIIGTLNTADRSTALLDAALRRRFQFEELMPTPGTITGLGNGRIPDGEGDEIDLRRLLTVMNERITYLLHRDQTIGHSYLVRVKDFDGLRRVLLHEVLPLLQEYFYEDWRRIRLVFGDVTAPADLQIVREIKTPAATLFGPTDDDLPEAMRYEIRAADEITPDAVRKIYEPLA